MSPPCPCGTTHRPGADRCPNGGHSPTQARRSSGAARWAALAIVFAAGLALCVNWNTLRPVLAELPVLALPQGLEPPQGEIVWSRNRRGATRGRFINRSGYLLQKVRLRVQLVRIEHRKGITERRVLGREDARWTAARDGETTDWKVAPVEITLPEGSEEEFTVPASVPEVPVGVTVTASGREVAVLQRLE
jgi:hypothetical protein